MTIALGLTPNHDISTFLFTSKSTDPYLEPPCAAIQLRHAHEITYHLSSQHVSRVTNGSKELTCHVADIAPQWTLKRLSSGAYILEFVKSVEIFYELKNAEVDEASEDKKIWEEKQTKTSSATTETGKPSGIVRSSRQQDLKSIADMEPEGIQDSPKKQTKGRGATTEAGKPGDVETSEPSNLQHSPAFEPEGGQKPELRRSPRKKQR
ncbi:hypothetical protein OCU04_004764 [Sclerotinia nivalis]|uniref:Uncharacterized protein n=1 Tax=Sclerotinia nivalis TaxID=352851 RepID=A0A9X0DLG9_9HELO|nr:hypothetical protein OCU04_004764 [Sclerotinia nivalis]